MTMKVILPRHGLAREREREREGGCWQCSPFLLGLQSICWFLYGALACSKKELSLRSLELDIPVY